LVAGRLVLLLSSFVNVINTFVNTLWLAVMPCLFGSRVFQFSFFVTWQITPFSAAAPLSG